jgi:hypothetical protein
MWNCAWDKAGSWRRSRVLATSWLSTRRDWPPVLGLIDNIEAEVIDAAHMEAGIVLAEYYAAEALRLGEAVRISAQLMKADELLDWLQDDWQEENISLPDIYQRGPYAIRDRNTAHALVKILEEHGWLIRVLQGALVRGQPRREVWRIVRRG